MSGCVKSVALSTQAVVYDSRTAIMHRDHTYDDNDAANGSEH